MKAPEKQLPHLLELLMAEAWPPAETVRLGDWRLRWAWGLTRRANSVLASGEPDLDLSEAVDAAEAFYAERGLIARFRLCSATVIAGLRDELARRGYREDAATLVDITQVEAVARAVDGTGWDLAITRELTDDWWSVYAGLERGSDRTASADGDVRRRHIGTLLRPAAPVVFVTARRDGVAVAIGQGVAQGEWLCIQCMGTLTAHRRRGAARAVLSTLGQWGAAQGCQRAHLAVLRTNTAAQGLYQSAGFRPVASYSYMVQGDR
jgi:ribosomal protein S18 acetylase RimI-like enzyme